MICMLNFNIIGREPEFEAINELDHTSLVKIINYVNIAPNCRQLAGGSTLYLQHMMGEYLRRYGRLVDGPEEENKGLANFTAAAKALSMHWTQKR